MKRIRESLEYPIPFWLSPIFLLSIFILWGLFQASYKLTPDSWEFLKWVIERIVYVATVAGAAYWAQHRFNINARERENRERKLKHIEIMMTDISKIFNLFKKYRNNSVREMSKEYMDDITELISSLNASSALYRLNVEDSINAFTQNLFSVDYEYSKSIGEKPIKEEIYSPLIQLGNLRIDCVMRAFKKLKDDIIDLHEEVEQGKTKGQPN
jgi:hypothetical protein